MARKERGADPPALTYELAQRGATVRFFGGSRNRLFGHMAAVSATAEFICYSCFDLPPDSTADPALNQEFGKKERCDRDDEFCRSQNYFESVEGGPKEQRCHSARDQVSQPTFRPL